MKRLLKLAGWSVLLLVVAVLIAVVFFGGPIVKCAINSVGPRLLGVPVTVQAANLALFQGQLQLKGLHVGNPAGFKTSALIELDTIAVDFDPASLFKKLVVIREVRIEVADITYERALMNSNLGQLLDQLSPKNAPTKEGGKKVVIQKLILSGARVHPTITALGGHAPVLPLPLISLSNIGGTGEDAKGATFLEALRDVLGTVFKSVTDVVTGAGRLALDGVKSAGGLATDGMKAVGTGAGKAYDSVKNLMGLGGKAEQPDKSGK
jgi:hypothetical protein